MKQFTLQHEQIQIEVDNVTYTVKDDDATTLLYSEAVAEYQNAAKKYESLTKQTADLSLLREGIVEMTAYVQKTIDLLLGEGTFQTFYEATGGRVYPLLELTNYVTNEVAKRVSETVEKLEAAAAETAAGKTSKEAQPEAQTTSARRPNFAPPHN